MSQPESGPLNPAVLRELVDLDDGAKGLVAEMTGMFRTDSPVRLATIRAALEAGDLEQAARTAHALKGAAGTIGAHHLKNLAGEVEAAARRGAAEGLLTRVLDLDGAYAEALTALEAFLAE
jgi:two-component system sensor histidine kinase BarA